MPTTDIFVFLGPWWAKVGVIGLLLTAMIFVGVGAYLDFRDWRSRPPRSKT